MACTEFEASADTILMIARSVGVSEQIVASRLDGRECISHSELLAEAEAMRLDLRPFGLPYNFSGVPATTTTVVADRSFTATPVQPARAAGLPATGGTETGLMVGGTLALIVGVFLARISRRPAVG